MRPARALATLKCLSNIGGGGGGTHWSMGGAAGGYQGGSTVDGYANSSGPQTAYSYNIGSNTSGSQDGTQQTAADSLITKAAAKL